MRSKGAAAGASSALPWGARLPRSTGFCKGLGRLGWSRQSGRQSRCSGGAEHLDHHRMPSGFVLAGTYMSRKSGKETVMTDIVIASAARTAVGAFNGGLAGLAAHQLGEVAIVEALRRAQVEPKEVSEVILGQILAAGEGQNPARQAAVAAGIPFEV